jgi:small subunit ribosomal protein S4
MARDRQKIGKISRREGVILHPKAAKVLAKKSYAPGMHGGSRSGFRKQSEYGTQLREKQKIKRMYGLLEKQFSKLVAKAIKKEGQSGLNMIMALEARADNIVYRSGLASSRRQARQMVNHGHFLLNDKKFNIPSLVIKPGDVIRFKDSSKKSELFNTAMAEAKGSVSSWIKLDTSKGQLEVLSIPKREDVVEEINEQLVVEFYSR